jgi:hypothetical protein
VRSLLRSIPNEQPWILSSLSKVETPIHDSLRELHDLGVQRAWSEIMHVLANPKGSVGRCRQLFQAVDLFKTKQRSNCEATKMMARKS